MKEHQRIEEIPNPKRKSISLPALLAAVALGLSATGACAQYIITPNQFVFLNWDGQLAFSMAGAYPGDPPPGYGYAPNGFPASAAVIIPLGSSLPAGWNVYDIYEWIPNVNSESYNVLEIAADGNLNNPQPIPWPGQFGSNVQYLQIPQNDQGSWLKLGPGPQSDPTLDGGYGVWINGSDNPFLEIRSLGFSNGGPESFDAFMLVLAVPEPSALALDLLGGFALLAGISRRLRLRS